MKLKKMFLALVCLVSLTACGNKEANKTTISSEKDNDKRYSAFFEDEFIDMASDMWSPVSKPSFLFSYIDLDKDGSDELVIGDEEGIYFVITEIDGKYNISGSYGWQNQHGPLPARYVGDGYFINFYWGTSSITTELTHYEPSIKNMGIIARLEGDEGWNLDILSEGRTPNVFAVKEYDETLDESNYTHYQDDEPQASDYIELKYFDSEYWHGDGYGCIDNSEICQRYIDLVASKEESNILEELEWRPVGELIFKDSKINSKKDISPKMTRLLSDVATATCIVAKENYDTSFEVDEEELIGMIGYLIKDTYMGYNGKISKNKVIASDGSTMTYTEFEELVKDALEEKVSAF
jgi:hypothetical protein